MAVEAVTVNRLPTSPSTDLRGARGSARGLPPSEGGDIERTQSQFKAKFWDGDAAMPSPSFPSDHAMVVAKVTLKTSSVSSKSRRLWADAHAIHAFTSSCKAAQGGGGGGGDGGGSGNGKASFRTNPGAPASLSSSAIGVPENGTAKTTQLPAPQQMPAAAVGSVARLEFVPEG
eukprot:SAG22_NODE_4369_length_1290_cov_1.095718_2_plen_174_part_00